MNKTASLCGAAPPTIVPKPSLVNKTEAAAPPLPPLPKQPEMLASNNKPSKKNDSAFHCEQCGLTLLRFDRPLVREPDRPHNESGSLLRRRFKNGRRNN